MYICKGGRFCFLLRFVDWIMELYRQHIYFHFFSFYFYLKPSILINFQIIYMYYYFRSSNPSCDTLFSERNTTIS